MVMDTGLADRIRAKGVRVIEVAGWKTRSAGSYDPEGSVNHHTAGSSRGATPSLATVLYGRTDVPGPLAQVLQSREPEPAEDIAYVVCAGRSNNAGRGSWRGVSGNSRMAGLEIEHTGIGRVDSARLEIAARIQAALLETPGSSRDAGMCCQHFEWTSRKVDFHDLAPWTPASFRARVAYWIGRTPADEEEDMPTIDEIRQVVREELARDNDAADLLIKGNGAGLDLSKPEARAHAAKWYALGAMGKRHITSREEADHLIFTGKLKAEPGNLPAEWKQSVVDAIDDVATADT